MEKDEDVIRNVLGEPLEECSSDPETGFFRNGYCQTCEQDSGSHTVCAEMTEEFLEYSGSRGNDLVTPRPEFNFPGLSAGDKWCLCAARWKEAYDAGKAPLVSLNSTEESALEVVDLDKLKEYSSDLH